jgi:hypothetical protein
MTYHRSIKKSTEIFSGALWPQRHLWQKAIPLLPANSYLLVVNPENEKQARLMHKLAQSFRDKGRQVHIWISPTRSNTLES